MRRLSHFVHIQSDAVILDITLLWVYYSTDSVGRLSHYVHIQSDAVILEITLLWVYY